MGSCHGIRSQDRGQINKTIVRTISIAQVSLSDRETVNGRYNETRMCFRFIGEETAAKEGCLPQLTNDPTWIIDPIDGTTNFVHHFPHTCISVALLVNKKAEIGIIYNPLMRQFFSARRHCGSFLNGKRIKTSDVKGKLQRGNTIN